MCLVMLHQRSRYKPVSQSCGGGTYDHIDGLRHQCSTGCTMQILTAAQMSAGMRLIQILPVNDTSVHRMWWDSYPYSSLSVRLHQVPGLCYVAPQLFTQ